MSTVLVRPFGPLQGGATQNIAVTASTQNQVITPNGIGYRSIRIVNVGTQTVFVTFGKDNTVTASLTTSMPVAASSVEVFTLDQDITYIAVIAAATGSTVYYTVGQGI